MPDITMCGGMVDGRECPIREHCYRFMAHNSVMQSYFADPPGEWRIGGDDVTHFECAFFLSREIYRALEEAVSNE